MAKKNIHVVPSGNRWAVKPEGAEKPLSTHRTQELATDAGKKVAQQNQGELVIHRQMARFATKTVLETIRVRRRTPRTKALIPRIVTEASPCGIHTRY